MSAASTVSFSTTFVDLHYRRPDEIWRATAKAGPTWSKTFVALARVGLKLHSCFFKKKSICWSTSGLVEVLAPSIVTFSITFVDLRLRRSDEIWRAAAKADSTQRRREWKCHHKAFRHLRYSGLGTYFTSSTTFVDLRLCMSGEIWCAAAKADQAC